MKRLFKLLQSDKVLHFLICYFIVSALSVINIIAAISVASVVAVAKELIDARVDYKDIIADVAGISCAVIIYFILV